MHKRELAAALVDGCVELSSSSAGSSSGVLGWSRAATPLRVQADVAQAKRGFELAHAARVERGTHSRTSARRPRRRRRGSCGGRSGRSGRSGRAPVLFAGALRSFVGAQGREAHQAHPPRRRRPLRPQWVTRTAAAARTWTGTRAVTVAERSWFWVKKTGSKHCRGAPAACNAARTARCRCCHCCRRCYVFPVPLPGCCAAAVAVASKAAKNILGARPGRALLSHAWRLGRAAAGADGPGYRAPRLRLSSCVG